MQIIYCSKPKREGLGVSLFASQDFVTEVGLSISAHLVLLAEVNLVGVFVFLALEGASEFGVVHFIFVAVAWIHSVVKRRRQLILYVFIKVGLFAQSHVRVIVILSKPFVEMRVLILFAVKALSTRFILEWWQMLTLSS